MIIAAAPEPLVDVGVAAGAASAVLALVAVVARSRPARWLVRRVVVEPLTRWFRQQVGEVVDERLSARPLTNGWGTNAVAAIAEATGADVGPPHRPAEPGGAA